MHALGATQELARRQGGVDDELATLGALADATETRLRDLNATATAAAAAAAEERRLAAAQRERQATLETRRVDAEAAYEKSSALERATLENATLAGADGRARARAARADALARQRHNRSLELEEETVALSEALRSATDEILTVQKLEDELAIEALKRAAEIARVRAEAEARAEMERLNEDVRLRAMRARAHEARERLLAAISLAFDYAARGAMALLSDDPRMLATLVGAVVACVGGAFFAREAAVLARNLAEAYFGRPRLVRETSRIRAARFRHVCHLLFLLFLAQPAAWARREATRLGRALLRRGRVAACHAARVRDPKRRERARALAARLAAAADADAAAETKAAADAVAAEEAGFLDGVVLPADLRRRLVQLANATRNAKANRSPFRHMLLHGPPGTGKTLVAKRLAKATGLEYALMSGGDVGPLGPEGVTALHSLFRWSRTSSKGVLVFIDEAEAFLASRSNGRLTEHMRNALNAFLYQTGSPTSHFVLVLATNRASDLDEAVLDRTDEELYVGLPDLAARRHLVELYYDLYLRKLQRRGGRLAAVLRFLGGRPAPLDVGPGVDDAATLAAVAEQTEGFSGRAIEKLFVAVQSIAYGNDGRLDAATLRSVVDHKVREHARKRHMDGEHGRPEAPAQPARAWITDAMAGVDEPPALAAPPMPRSEPAPSREPAELVLLEVEDEAPSEDGSNSDEAPGSRPLAKPRKSPQVKGHTSPRNPAAAAAPPPPPPKPVGTPQADLRKVPAKPKPAVEVDAAGAPDPSELPFVEKREIFSPSDGSSPRSRDGEAPDDGAARRDDRSPSPPPLDGGSKSSSVDSLKDAAKQSLEGVAKFVAQGITFVKPPPRSPPPASDSDGESPRGADEVPPLPGAGDLRASPDPESPSSFAVERPFAATA